MNRILLYRLQIAGLLLVLGPYMYLLYLLVRLVTQ